METSLKSRKSFHRSTFFRVTSSAFPCPFIAFTKSQAAFIVAFLRDFLNISEIHIRGDPS